MSHLSLVNLTKKYGKVTAISRLNLEVENRKITVLLGPTAAGKTTTLRCIAGLEKPQTGDIFIDGERINDLPPKDRDVAFVFQNFSLYPRYTVFENIASPLRIRNISKDDIDKNVKRVAHMLHIEHLLERKPIFISGGEMQRVAIARALVRNPRVFLLDEPLTNLDAKIREETRTELKRLQNETGATFFYATPDQTDALSIGDRIVIINEGHVIQIGSPYEIYHQPANLFVADFVGSPAMNFLPALYSENGCIDVGPNLMKIQLSKEKIEKCRQTLTSQEIIIGIRPEDITISLEKNEQSFLAQVELIEPLGVSQILQLKLNFLSIRVRSEKNVNIALNSSVYFTIKETKIHVFDKKTEKRIA
ncbi:MAG: ABC transporter ATP-binding protein [Candidatus Atribacteria bacterium]|nr:ABC transporter ATP-binding protein [Candidatus Atribacteria bacterium]